MRSVVATLLCGSPLERRTLDLLYPLLRICKETGIYDLWDIRWMRDYRYTVTEDRQVQWIGFPISFGDYDVVA